MEMEGTNILIVDDDRLITLTLVQGLRELGYNAYGAQSAGEARQLIAEHQVELVVVDSKMPGESGSIFARWLRQETEIPFLFLSAYSDRQTVEAAVDAGALAYVVKPVQVSQLVPMLEAVRERAQEIAELRAKEHKLQRAIASNRQISVAVGLIMARHGLLKGEAFEKLREKARARRRKVEDFAAELVEAEELLSTAVR
ncbi:ANTAR domain-containing response regulator [Spiribacter halobius]|uniref:Response regulator n=1 Tax=Sediminicurvatus halobius TaxID=2182432 RepID=A0A2U2MWK4_9GAMM|nr:response regulator [Spiribacter halobius]PWG61224.1 response regulator [Spiribacter halobius]UEX79195.1 response regulator [Spiribacter halobius]